MKKLWLFCLIAATAAFASCSKDNDNSENQTGRIIGKWEVYQYVEERNGTLHNEYYGSALNDIWTYEFRNDGSGVETENYLYNDRWNSFEDPFTYSVSGNSLRIKYVDDGESYIYSIEKLTSTKLVLINKTDGSYSDILYLQRY